MHPAELWFWPEAPQAAVTAALSWVLVTISGSSLAWAALTAAWS